MSDGLTLLQTKALAAAAAFATLQPAIAAAAQEADADCKGTAAVLAYPALADPTTVPLPVMEIVSLQAADVYAADTRSGELAESDNKLEASPTDVSLCLSTGTEEPADSHQSSADAALLQGLGKDTPMGAQSDSQHVRPAQQQARLTVDSGGHAPKGKPDCSAESLPEAQPAHEACLGASQSLLAGAGAQAPSEQQPAAAAHAKRLPRSTSQPPAARQDSPAGSTLSPAAKHSTLSPAAGHSAAARAAGPETAVRAAGSQPATQTALLPALAGSSSSRAAHVLTSSKVPATSVAAAAHAARLAAPTAAAVIADAPLQTGSVAPSQVRQHSSLEGSTSGEVVGCSEAALHEPRAATTACIWTSSGLATRVDSPAAAAAAVAPSPELQPGRAPEAERPPSDAGGNLAHRHRLKRQRAAGSEPAARARPAPAPSVRPALDALTALVDAHSLRVLDYMTGKQHPLSPPRDLHAGGI